MHTTPAHGRGPAPHTHGTRAMPSTPHTHTCTQAMPRPTAPMILRCSWMKVSSLVMQPPCRGGGAAEGGESSSRLGDGATQHPRQLSRPPPAYLHFVDVGGVVPPPTARHHGLAAAVGDHSSVRFTRADPLAVLPVPRVVAAAAVELQQEQSSGGAPGLSPVARLPQRSGEAPPCASQPPTSCCSLSTALVTPSWPGWWYRLVMVPLRFSLSSAFSWGEGGTAAALVEDSEVGQGGSGRRPAKGGHAGGLWEGLGSGNGRWMLAQTGGCGGQVAGSHPDGRGQGRRQGRHSRFPGHLPQPRGSLGAEGQLAMPVVHPPPVTPPPLQGLRTRGSALQPYCLCPS